VHVHERVVDGLEESFVIHVGGAVCWEIFHA
jgi:hypothetical protein